MRKVEVCARCVRIWPAVVVAAAERLRRCSHCSSPVRDVPGVTLPGYSIPGSGGTKQGEEQKASAARRLGVSPGDLVIVSDRDDAIAVSRRALVDNRAEGGML